VFVTLPVRASSSLVSLSPIYEWAKNRGVDIQGEHLMIESVPVQLLPACNSLVEESVATARVHDYEGVPVRVVDPEHLVPSHWKRAARGGASARGSSCSSVVLTVTGVARS